jgi:hypothetical protein
MLSTTFRKVVVGMITAAVVGLVVVWWLGRPRVIPPADGTGKGVIRQPSRPVTIRGDVKGPILPGSLVALNLSFVNHNSFELTLDRVTVRVRSIHAPRADRTHACTSADFKVRQLARSVELRLAGKSTRRLSAMGLSRAQWPAVGMLDRPVNQDGCKGALLRLDYKASGLEVHR